MASYVRRHLDRPREFGEQNPDEVAHLEQRWNNPTSATINNTQSWSGSFWQVPSNIDDSNSSNRSVNPGFGFGQMHTVQPFSASNYNSQYSGNANQQNFLGHRDLPTNQASAQNPTYFDDQWSNSTVPDRRYLNEPFPQTENGHSSGPNASFGFRLPTNDDRNNDRNRVRRKKFMPVKRNELELFNEEERIQEGEFFDEIVTAENGDSIVISGGDDCPKLLIKEFANCGFTTQIMDNLKLKKYNLPTLVQKSVIPLIQRKTYDLMGHAQTGSGKTAAFLLPIIDLLHKRIMDNQSTYRTIGQGFNHKSPFLLIISPTKELAEQLFEDARSFAVGTRIGVTRTYGDMPMRLSMDEMKNAGCDIMIGTCGRMKHFIEDGIIKLDQLEFFVLDEADRLIGPKQVEFLQTVELIKNHPNLNPDHRTLMFSATFGDEVQEISQKFLKKDFYFVRVGELNSAVDTINQIFISVERHCKQDLLIELLNQNKIDEQLDSTGDSKIVTPKIMIFVGQKRQSDRIAVALSQENFLAQSLNSDRTLQQRMDTVNKFKLGRYTILVATDVAARGLNIPRVEVVINYDLPELDNLHNYIHRIGRTGRAGNTGTAISFFDPYSEDRRNAEYYLRQLEKSRQTAPEFLLEMVCGELDSARQLFNSQYQLSSSSWGGPPSSQNHQSQQSPWLVGGLDPVPSSEATTAAANIGGSPASGTLDDNFWYSSALTTTAATDREPSRSMPPGQQLFTDGGYNIDRNQQVLHGGPKLDGFQTINQQDNGWD